METLRVLPKPVSGKSRKVLALLLLRRALMEERYEECRVYLDEAKTGGAASEEIVRVLKAPGQHPEEVE